MVVTGYQDRRADQRVEDRQEGIGIAQRRITQALQYEGMTPEMIAKVIDLRLATPDFQI